MSPDVEEVVRRELDAVSAEVTPRPEWTAAVLTGLEHEQAKVRRRRLASVVAAAAVVALVVVVVGARGAGRPQPAPEPDRTTRHQMVDIGGRSLGLSCWGVSPAGTPTVVLETGLGGHAATYDEVRADLADELRVCTYDRAGTGQSHAANSFPRTARTLSDDLAALVEAGGLGRSIVLVTDGFTALSGAVFAGDHPELVTGLVFLDPRGPHVSRAEARALGEPAPGEVELLTELRSQYRTDSLSRNGEQVSYPASEAEVAALLDAPGPAFGETPVVVLSPALGRQALPPLPGAIRSRWWQAWQADQDLLASESTSGAVRDVPEVSGSLAASAPTWVSRAVREVAGLER